MACGVACQSNPQAAFDHAYQAFLRGDLQQAQDEAEKGRHRFQGSGSEWVWKFRILEAESLLWRGMSPEALALLKSQSPQPTAKDSLIEMLAIEGVAYCRVHSLSEADASLKQAEQLCAGTSDPICGSVLRARGILALERGQLTQGREFFEQFLAFSRAKGDRFSEGSALLNLSASSLKEGHFDEAVDWSEAAHRTATAINAGNTITKALGNLGWAYYRLGDLERSLQLFLELEKRDSQLGNVFDQENELTNIGYIYFEQGKYDLAGQSFKEALRLAKSIDAKQDIYNALRILARLAVEINDLAAASEYAAQALEIARSGGSRADELYPLLVQGEIAARQNDRIVAENIFQQVQHDNACPVFLKWEAQHSLAHLYENENRADLADREYQAAVATFESARSDIRRQDSQLSFLTNGWRIYHDYIHFLVSHSRTDDALRWADFSRARTLAEGLGILPTSAAEQAPPLRAAEIARGAGGTVLFYWLGEKQSYLWAVSAKGTKLFYLPPGPEIDAAVQRYRKTLTGPQDALSDEDGRWLYRTLVAPAQSMFAKDAPVYIIPDGTLNYLNFETLLVTEPAPHYWIEDATITNASSLRVLASIYKSNGKSRSLLLIGNTVAPNPQYPELPNAAAQMESVSRHFPPEQERIFAREQANTKAYVESNPEQFSHIHFVAHGISSRLSPLDSAIVLSPSGSASDSFKLYGRDIIQHHLRADLVTISACYGAGERWYSGEGLVGLSWAFLRAGAHNVIAALWEVSDASVEKLMAKFYEETDKGASPDSALRSAKLSLLHSNEFRKPFYWAPFQLYTQGRAAGARRPANVGS